MLRTWGSTANKPRESCRLRLERLEDRTLPATSITIMAGASGTGSQDTAFLAHNGQLLFADPDAGGNTLSTGALTAISATSNILVEATQTISFDDLGGTLVLKTGPGNTVTFSTATAGGGAIAFSNRNNTLATSGGDIALKARGDLMPANLDTGGGNASLTAGLNGPAVLSAQSILTGSSGDITLTADDMSLAQPISAGAGRIILQPNTTSLAIHLGSPGLLGSYLGFTETELNKLNAGVLQIGAAGRTAGTITFTAPISLGSTSTLYLVTQGAIVTDTSANVPDITTTNLALLAGTGIGGTGASFKTSVVNLAFSNGAGSVIITNTGNLTMAAVGPLTTSTNAGSTQSTSTAISASGSLTIAVNVTGQGSSMSFTTTGHLAPLTVEPGVTISNENILSLSAQGDLTVPATSVLVAHGPGIFLAGGPVITVNSALDSPGGTAISGEAGNDTFNIDASSPPGVLLNGSVGSDRFNITPTVTPYLIHDGFPQIPATSDDSLNIVLAGITNPQLSATRMASGYAGAWSFGNRASVHFDGIQTLVQETRIAVAVDSGKPEVRVLDSTGSQIADFFAFTPIPWLSAHVAVGDVNGDGVQDIIVAAAVDSSHIKVIDGTKLNMIDANGEIDNAALIAQFYAYDPRFLGGCYVAFGLGAGGLPEIVTGAARGGGPHVKVIDATKLNELQNNSEIADGALLGQFYAYSPIFYGGVRVAAADINGDGVLDIITGTGEGGGPHVKVVDGNRLHDLQADSEPAATALLGQFYAFDPTKSDGGVYVAASGVGSQATIVTGSDGSTEVRLINGAQLSVLDHNSEPTGAALLGDFFAYDPTSYVGARVAEVDVNNDGVPDIITAPGNGAALEVKAFDGINPNLIDTLFASGDMQGFSIGAG
jgi:hypothetical protein